MKLVSAAKLRRAQDAAIFSRSFSDDLLKVLKAVLGQLPDNFSSPLIVPRAVVKRRRIIVIAGDRGLCGPYNTNVLRAAHQEITNSAVETEVVCMGRRAVSAAKRFGWKTVAEYESLPEDANQWPVSEIFKKAVNDYSAEKIDEVVLFYTKFVTAMTQRVTREVVLPVTIDSLSLTAEQTKTPTLPATFSPQAAELMTSLLPLALEMRFRLAGLESKASEHAARMSAMDSATRNADDLMGKLRLFYNRARQSSITKELLDIIGGAEALK